MKNLVYLLKKFKKKVELPAMKYEIKFIPSAQNE